MSQHAEFKCLCGEPLRFPMPAPSFINKVGVTIIVFVHEKPQRCLKCRQAYVFAVNGIGITEGGFVAAEVPEETIIEAPPPNFKPPRMH